MSEVFVPTWDVFPSFDSATLHTHYGQSWSNVTVCKTDFRKERAGSNPASVSKYVVLVLVISILDFHSKGESLNLLYDSKILEVLVLVVAYNIASVKGSVRIGYTSHNSFELVKDLLIQWRLVSRQSRPILKYIRNAEPEYSRLP